MADKKGAPPPGPPQPASDADKARARQWFKKAADCRDKRDYDYAIECFITGLAYWPEAIEEGHMPLRSLAIQRQQAGGKKPGMLETLKRPVNGKDSRQALFNAETYLSKDPASYAYAEAMLKNAVKAGFLLVARFIAPVAYDILKREEKPNKAKYKSYRDTLVEAAEAAGDGPTSTALLEKAVESLEYLIARSPGDEDLRNEQRDLAGQLTIARGKYAQAEDFRDSLQDADKQKLLHDAERARQGDDTLENLIEGTRREYEAAPNVPQKLNAYVDALLKPERKVEEDRAIKLLLKHYEQSKNYNLKVRADDVVLRQLGREVRQLKARAQETGADDDKQQWRLAVLEQRQRQIDVFRERVAQYPTDLRAKYRLGEALFVAGAFDEAIPMLQLAQGDPRSRVRAQLYIGRAFYETKNPLQAAEVLREALDRYELTDDNSKELMYWLARAYEAADNLDEAKAVFGRLLRQDYNYRDGDARKRLEALQKTGSGN